MHGRLNLAAITAQEELVHFINERALILMSSAVVCVLRFIK